MIEMTTIISPMRQSITDATPNYTPDTPRPTASPLLSKYSIPSYYSMSQSLLDLMEEEEEVKALITFEKEIAVHNELKKNAVFGILGTNRGNVLMWDIFMGPADDLLQRTNLSTVDPIDRHYAETAKYEEHQAIQSIHALAHYHLESGDKTFIIAGGSTDKHRTDSISNEGRVVIWEWSYKGPGTNQIAGFTPIKTISRDDVVNCLAVFMQRDLLIAVGTADRKIVLYSLSLAQDKNTRTSLEDRNTVTPLNTLTLLKDFVTIHTDPISSLQFLPPDEFEFNEYYKFSKIVNDKMTEFNVLSVGWDKRMVLWDKSGKKKHEFEDGHTKAITIVVVHKSDSKKAWGKETRDVPHVLLTGSLDNTVLIWDLSTKRKIRRLVGHEGQINAIKVCDGKDDGSPPIVLTASDDKTIILWDLLTGSCFRTIFSNEPLKTLGIISSEDGIITISSGVSPNLLIWNLCGGNRSRTFKTGAVTSIDVHTSPRDGKARVVIGSVDRSFTVFEIEKSEEHLCQRQEFHTNRINAGIIFDHHIENPLVISADSNAKIKVWELDNPTAPEWKNFSGHTDAVLAVAVYNPFLFGRELKPNEISKGRANLTIPFILSAGLDKSIKLWDLLGLGGFLREIPEAHTSGVRSIVVYHPCDPNEKPRFISGSFDRTAKLWDLETFEALRVFAVHKHAVFSTAIYDPRTQYNPATPDLTREKVVPAVITSSYDRSFAVWDMELDEPPRIHKTDAHRDSVTALAVYTPPFQSNEDPLVVTGSVDRFIHIYNLFSGEKMHTLVGHSDRVNYLCIYVPIDDKARPAILSGGDDGKTILWKDSLQQAFLPPLRESVRSAFEFDLGTSDWPLITEMAKRFGMLIFFENTNLFMRALLKRRGDFLIKFWDFLTIVLPTIKPEALPEDPDDVTRDILSVAILLNDTAMVRTILLAWIKILNHDMDDMLFQSLYHASYFFPYKALELLFDNYPPEFVKFIVSLRLVENHPFLMVTMDKTGKLNEIRRRKLDLSSRFEVRPSYKRVNLYDFFWKDFLGSDSVQILQNLCEYIVRSGFWLSHFSLFIPYDFLIWFDRFSKRKIAEQPVTSMMVPLSNCNNVYKYLGMFVKVSDQLDDLSIFDSEVAIVLLHYFWQIRGRSYHLVSFAKYLFFFIVMLVCVYSYETHYRDFPRIIVLSYFCIIGFAYYGIEEFRQMRAMHDSINVEIIIIHFSDLWNAVDISLVVNGFVGLALRLAYDRDTPTGRSFLAITSVLMWFKMLFFLRPFSNTGPLVAMIVQIASKIRVFLVVLFCVLAGFAQAFWILSNNNASLEFGTVQQSFSNSFFYMLGQNISGDFSGAASPFVAQVFLFFFLITMMILMLNLLIALMGDVFSKVRAKGVALWRKEQASIIIEEKFMGQSRYSYLLPYVFVLKYTSEVKKSSINFRKELRKLSSVVQGDVADNQVPEGESKAVFAEI